MEDFIKIISHVRRFKTATKDLNVEELGEIKTKLEKIIEDRIASEADAKRKDAEKEEKIENYRKMLAADGIDLEELLAEAAVKKGKRPPRPAKYTTKDKDGNTVTWTGQGRMPGALKARIEAGESLESFLIK